MYMPVLARFGLRGPGTERPLLLIGLTVLPVLGLFSRRMREASLRKCHLTKATRRFFAPSLREWLTARRIIRRWATS